MLYTLIELGTGHAGASKGMPFNLCLLLDRSGSMDGKKIENLKEAVKRVVDSLGEKDRISVVIFDDEVEALLANQRRQIRPRLRTRLTASCQEAAHRYLMQ